MNYKKYSTFVANGKTYFNITVIEKVSSDLTLHTSFTGNFCSQPILPFIHNGISNDKFLILNVEQKLNISCFE